MQFISTTGLILAMLPVAFAAPANTTPNHDSLATAKKRAGYDFCRVSSFFNNTGSTSPLVKDCQKIVSNIKGGGAWVVHANTSRDIVSYGTCKMIIINEKQGSQSIIVGSADVTDLINDSIAKFQGFGVVSAVGDMPCLILGSDKTSPVTWFLAHT